MAAEARKEAEDEAARERMEADAAKKREKMKMKAARKKVSKAASGAGSLLAAAAEEEAGSADAVHAWSAGLPVHGSCTTMSRITRKDGASSGRGRGRQCMLCVLSCWASYAWQVYRTTAGF